MATTEGNTRPSAAQGPTVPSNPTNQQACSYCQRPISKRILAARKPYCGKLCAALGLIRALDDDAFDEDYAADALTDLVLNAYFDETVKIPIRVRWSDALKYQEYMDVNEYLVVVDDESAPDWVPEDDVVDKSLVSDGPLSGNEVSLKPLTQASTPSAVVLSMPKIPQYPAVARDVFELTDVELSTLFDTYHADGIDPNGCSALHRQTIATQTKCGMIEYAEIAKLWRVTAFGECVVTTTKLLCDPSSPYRSLQESKMAKVLTFSAPTAESRAQ